MTTKVVVLGATGPSGICLLRELLHRQYPTVAYVRNAAKIPEELSANRLLTVSQGTMEDREAFSVAAKGADIVIFLLGPTRGAELSPYADYYTNTVFPVVRENSIKKIIATATPSASAAEDSFSVLLQIQIALVKLIAPGSVPAIRKIAAVFRDVDDLEWTVGRLPWVKGDASEEGWRKDREGTIIAGYVGDKEGTYSLSRGALARWLVNLVESGQGQWLRKLPALSQAKD